MEQVREGVILAPDSGLAASKIINDLPHVYFSVHDNDTWPPRNAKSKAFLQEDRWDDFGFKTQHRLVLFDAAGKRHEIGHVKIGKKGMSAEAANQVLPRSFDKLDDEFFSVGQSESYYIALAGVGDEIRRNVLASLRDIAFAPDLVGPALQETVTKESLLRGIGISTITKRYRRLAHGDARLTRYSFSYHAPTHSSGTDSQYTLAFEVIPDTAPPTNIHVLIGRNGVGKTYVLTKMLHALISRDGNANNGRFTGEDYDDESSLFRSIVSVSFSAFDPFSDLPQPGALEPRESGQDIRPHVSYIGLKQTDRNNDEWSEVPKHLSLLSSEFVDSLLECVNGPRAATWRRVIELLYADPVFANSRIADLADKTSRKNGIDKARIRFETLSSGHKIVLLTITKLVEKVEERTLVLLDEPEGHLHPPLLSAFIRAISDLLIQRNGVAIIATHSPVVLQEVPRNCAWNLRRIGDQASAERLEIESFGENVGILTREVFGLEVTNTGFHKMLVREVGNGGTFESILEDFDGQLGSEARSIVRALLAVRDTHDKL